MTNRRDFLKQLGAAGFASGIPGFIVPDKLLKKPASDNEMIWSVLIHLSYNMWQDFTPPEYMTQTYLPGWTDEEVSKWAAYYHPHLTCEKDTWDSIIKKFSESGLNMVLIDLGDGVRYESHPEIAVENAWIPSELKKAIRQIRKYGMEPVPKLNFSAGHKAWLGPYQFTISSEKYHEVCKNLISEVVDIFDKPRFFHIGMDEETYDHQSHHNYIVIRKNDIWWKDLYYLVEQVERHNVRSWVWSDNVWRNKHEYLKKMPLTVLQSNWNYEENGPTFNENGEPNDPIAQAYIDLEKHGYDQVPSASIWLNGHWNNYNNFENIVKNTKRIIAPERLKGFMQTVWMPTLGPCAGTFYKAAEVVYETRKKYY